MPHDREVEPVEPDLPRGAQFAIRQFQDKVQNVQSIVAVRQIGQDRIFALCRRANQHRRQKRFRAKIFILILRGRGCVVGTFKEDVLVVQVELEFGAVRNHVECLRTDDRDLRLNADIRWFAEENESAAVGNLVDLTFVNAADGGRHLDGHLKRIDGIVDLTDAGDEVVSGGGHDLLLRCDCLAVAKKGLLSEQQKGKNPART